MKRFLLLVITNILFLMATGQLVQKFTFNPADSSSGYYLAIEGDGGLDWRDRCVGV